MWQAGTQCNSRSGEQKLSYIKGICRNRFNYWNDQSGSIILNNYTKALKEYGWSEERILDDLETELIPKTKEAKSWTDWRNLVEKWTEDVRGWEKSESTEEIYEISEDELGRMRLFLFYKKQHDILPALIFIGKAFENFDDNSLPKILDMLTQHYLTALIEYYKLPDRSGARKPSWRKSLHDTGLSNMYMPINDMLTFYLDHALDNILEQYFLYEIEIYNDENAKAEYFEQILRKYLAITELE